MNRKKLIALSILGLTVVGSLSPSLTVSASENYSYSNNSTNEVKLTLSPQDYYRINLISKLDSVLSLSENNIITITKSDNEIMDEFGLTLEELTTVKGIINYYNTEILIYNSPYKDRMEVRDWHIYLSHDDVMQLGNMIIGLGPAAVAATVASFMSVVPGAGTIVGAVIGYFGAAPLVGNVAYAAATGRGLKIGLSGISAI